MSHGGRFTIDLADAPFSQPTETPSSASATGGWMRPGTSERLRASPRSRCFERRGEGFFEGVDFVEVVEGIGVLFSEDSVFDEEEDDLADVAALGDTPVIEEGGGHGAVFLDDIVAEALQEFLSADVALFAIGLA